MPLTLSSCMTDICKLSTNINCSYLLTKKTQQVCQMLTDRWKNSEVRGMINNDPVVWSFIIITRRTVSDGGPENWISLSGRPNPLEDLVSYVSIFGQPLQNCWCLEGRLPLHSDRRVPEVVTQLMAGYTLSRHWTELYIDSVYCFERVYGEVPWLWVHS